MAAKKRKLVRNVFWIGASKGTGFLRDIYLVVIFGLSAQSDELFLGMTIAMFSQLVGYHFGINIFTGYAAKVWKKYFSISVLLFIAFTTIFFDFLGVKYSVFEASLLWFFLSLSALSFYLGSGVALLVLKGDNDSHAINMTVQNLTILAGIFLVKTTGELQWVRYAWLDGLLVGANIMLWQAKIRLPKHETLKPLKEKNYLVPSNAFFAIMHPVTVFSVVLIERFYYAETHGMVAVVKILETLATSAIFVTNVTVLNKVLSNMDQEVSQGSLTVGHATALFFRSAKVSLWVAELLFFSGAGCILLFLWRFPTAIDGVMNIKDTLPFFVGLYGLYGAASILREHSERLLIVLEETPIVVIVGILIVILTGILNWLFLGFAPNSIILISISLAITKSFLLWKRVSRNIG